MNSSAIQSDGGPTALAVWLRSWRTCSRSAALREPAVIVRLLGVRPRLNGLQRQKTSRRPITGWACPDGPSRIFGYPPSRETRRNRAVELMSAWVSTVRPPYVRVARHSTAV